MGHYPDRGNTSVTAGKRSRQASVTRGQMPPPSHYPEVGSTSCRIHAWIYERIAICQTLETAYNPYRGRYKCAVNSGGGTRFAHLPPVIEIIPRSGYHTHATCLKGLKSLKGILAARLPLVIEVIPRLGYLIRCTPKRANKAKRHPCTGGIRLSPRLPPVIEITPLIGVSCTLLTLSSLTKC